MRQILIYLFILMFACGASAEPFKVTGKVVDAGSNEPIIGVTVEIKGQGAQRHTTTDIDGNFSIEVEKGQILKFSYVGYYSKEVEILNDSSLVIELEDNGNTFDDIQIQGWRPSPWRPTGPVRPIQPVEPDSSKTSPKNQNSMINH